MILETIKPSQVQRRVGNSRWLILGFEDIC
jgi:hypothetical protein